MSAMMFVYPQQVGPLKLVGLTSRARS